jgi:hypothetical protein
MRPAKGDELDRFLATVEDPDSWYVDLGQAFNPKLASVCAYQTHPYLVGPRRKTNSFKNKSNSLIKNSISFVD